MEWEEKEGKESEKQRIGKKRKDRHGKETGIRREREKIKLKGWKGLEIHIETQGEGLKGEKEGEDGEGGGRKG